MTLLDAQIDLLERRWPNLADSLGELDPPDDATWVTGVPHPTLRVNGIQLCGAVDPAAEARLQAAAVPLDAPHVTVYEPAQGHLPRVLLERPALARLEVVLLAPAAFLLGLDRLDHRDWLGDRRVLLRRAREDEHPRAPYALSPAGLRLAEPGAKHLRDQLVLQRASTFQRANAQKWDDQLAAALLANAELLRTSRDADDLAGRHPATRAIVVASGPSLKDQLDWLRNVRADHVVIAVNSALRPLRAAGITPDYVVAIDAHPALAAHVADVPATVPLVHGVAVHGDLLRAWPGPRFATRLSGPRYEALPTPRGRLWSAGTVTHTACALARHLGAQELVLLGADFSYPAGRTHLAGAPAASDLVDEGRRLKVTDGLGGEAPTDVNLLGYLRDLDDWLGAHPDLRARKRGREGAAMRNAPWMDDDGR